MSKSVSMKLMEKPDELPVGTPFIYADSITGVEFGSSVTKITYGMKSGEVSAVVAIPTLIFVEVMQKLNEAILTDPAVRDSILPGLEALRKKFSQSTE